MKDYKAFLNNACKIENLTVKELMKLTLEEKMAHGGHPVLRWMIGTSTS